MGSEMCIRDRCRSEWYKTLYHRVIQRDMTNSTPIQTFVPFGRPRPALQVTRCCAGAAHAGRAAGVRWRACPPGMVPGSHPLRMAVSKASIAVSPTALQAHRDDNRAASGPHLPVHIPDVESTMSMPSASATRYGRSTKMRLQQLSKYARSVADTSRSAACIDVCHTLPGPLNRRLPPAGAADRDSSSAGGFIDAGLMRRGVMLPTRAGAAGSTPPAPAEFLRVGSAK